MSTGDAHERADWTRIEKLYRQLVDVVDNHHRNAVLAGELAHAMARTCALYDGIEELFIEDLLGVIEDIEQTGEGREDRFKRLYHDASYTEFADYRKQGPGGRRLPTPFEAAVETCRRLRDVNRLREQLSRVPTGCILGGSASYGRFYNTVGQRDNEPSDLDLLLVAPSYELVPDIAAAFALVTGVREQDVEQMADRAQRFPKVKAGIDAGGRCIFSQKLKLWPATAPDEFMVRVGMNGQYDISVHVFSAEDVDYLILRDRPRLDEDRMIFDFRSTPVDRPDRQRSFAETEILDEREATECDGGFVVSSRVCHIGDAAPEPGSRYYPGQHQNLILPEFEIRWELDSHRLYLPLFAFKVKLKERLEREKARRPYEIQTIANSHTRKYQFAPYVGGRIDGPT